MIKEVTGDILFSTAQAIAHGIAPHDHFDSGLALSLRQQWPAMFKDFKHFCHQHNPRPGEIWMWVGENGERIINLFSQEPSSGRGHGGHAGRATEVHVNHVLHELKKLLAAEHIQSIALPRLSTGVGGLSWETVRPLIYQQLGDAGVDVYLYSTFSKGVKAAE